ncbi:hypothetical protein GCM10010359_54760 [Streptomyces morookaense]|nr:hypothetical protein GCM10010359_54760 [Streptomyces morookaense]
MVDTREGRIVQVIGGDGDRVQVRRPGGGLEWEVPLTALRLATREERAAAGLRPYRAGCEECVALENARRAATGGEEAGKASAAAYGHWIVAHSAEGRN